MRTVIIATKEHIEWINRYQQFFRPFLTPEIRFCEWNRAGDTLDTIVPSLYDDIDGKEEWQAVILFDDESTRGKINPFDLVVAQKPETEEAPESETSDDALVRYRKAVDAEVEAHRKEYESAVSMPLTRLATFLCEIPLDASKEVVKADRYAVLSYNSEEEKLSTDIEIRAEKEAASFNGYKKTSERKRELRKSILGKDVLRAHYPEEVYCVSLRTVADSHEAEAQRLDISWSSPVDVRYSDFINRNMYFDRMRFFVYDILPKEHVNYKKDYLAFIYTLLVFSGNRLPSGSVQSGRLYCLKSECRESCLKDLIAQYDQKLENTVSYIEQCQKEIADQMPGPMTDQQAEELFQSRKSVSVVLNRDFKENGMYVENDEFGLAADFPRREDKVWSEMYQKSLEVSRRMLKQPRRSLEKGVEEFRRQNREDNIQALGLNHFQIEDIQECAENEENCMVEVPTKNIYETDRYERQLDESNQDVKKMIAARMSRNIELGLGILCLVLFSVSFIPVLFFNERMSSVPVPLVMTLFSLAILALSGLLALFRFRRELKNAVIRYNETVAGIRNDVDKSMELFSEYLSHACRLMSENFVLAECRKRDNVFKQRIRVLRAHEEQIRDRQTELRELFGEYLGGHKPADSGERYRYNFEIVSEYEYPIPFSDDVEKRSIFFIEDDYRVRVPFAVISSISIKMEELYE